MAVKQHPLAAVELVEVERLTEAPVRLAAVQIGLQASLARFRAAHKGEIRTTESCAARKEGHSARLGEPLNGLYLTYRPRFKTGTPMLNDVKGPLLLKEPQ